MQTAAGAKRGKRVGASFACFSRETEEMLFRARLKQIVNSVYRVRAFQLKVAEIQKSEVKPNTGNADNQIHQSKAKKSMHARRA